MNITSKGKYPSNKLSNFAGHRFVFDGVEIYSMEGFLQALKFKNFEIQKHVCTLIGAAAKRKGANKNWKKHQILYWNNKQYPRKSKEYQKLLDDVYMSMFNQSDSFKRALIASKGTVLTHSIGKNKESETVLTKSEFCRRLTYLQSLL